MAMLEKKEFERIRKEIAADESKRESVISASREILLISKHLIYAIHRDDMNSAEKLEKDIRIKAKKLPRDECGTGMRGAALQEYAEAAALFDFVTKNRIPTAADLGIPTSDYLAGLADLTGELVRMAVNRAIKKDRQAVERIREAVDLLYGEFIQLDLRNSELRKKSDQVKWSLQKIEDVVYNMSRN